MAAGQKRAPERCGGVGSGERRNSVGEKTEVLRGVFPGKLGNSSLGGGVSQDTNHACKTPGEREEKDIKEENRLSITTGLS